MSSTQPDVATIRWVLEQERDAVPALSVEGVIELGVDSTVYLADGWNGHPEHLELRGARYPVSEPAPGFFTVHELPALRPGKHGALLHFADGRAERLSIDFGLAG